MENKYYVPEISEFHVGFEYETRYLALNMKDWCFRPIKGDWQELNMVYDDYEHEMEDFNKLYRVKYLDASDIESLGWKDCDNIYNTIRWDFNDYILMFYKKDNRYLIFRDCGPNNIQTVFNGFIKNKSELIKLQQQLNIK